STDTLCPEQDSSSKDRGGSLESRPNTTNDTTATSAKLNRPGLTHQGKHHSCVCVCVCVGALRKKHQCLLHLKDKGTTYSSSRASLSLMAVSQRVIAGYLLKMHDSFPTAWCLCSYGLKSKAEELDTHTYTELWRVFFRLFLEVLSM
ncbi:hypothetical protein XENORESO_017491, partial [Xenotaenia resolanae]